MSLRGLSAQRLTRCAMFAALTAICSQISIPLPAIPINLAIFSVLLAGSVLGPLDGLLSQLAFVLVGAVGMPVFVSFRGGLGVLVGPTGGYIVGYLVAAWLTGFLLQRWGRGTARCVLAMCCGLAACYTLGTVWFIILTSKGLIAALGYCVFPFLPGDAVKIAAATFVTRRLGKRFYDPVV